MVNRNIQDQDKSFRKRLADRKRKRSTSKGGPQNQEYSLDAGLFAIGGDESAIYTQSDHNNTDFGGTLNFSGEL